MNQLHRSIIHEHGIKFNLRIILRNLCHLFAPQARSFQHIGFVHQRQFPATRHRVGESQPRNPLDLKIGIVAMVISFGALGIPAFFTKINAPGQFAVDHQVRTAHPIFAQRRQVQQGFVGSHRADIGKQSQALAQAQQALLRAHRRRRVVVVPGMPDRAKENGVGTQAGIERFFGQRIAGFVNGYCTNRTVAIVEMVIVQFGHCVQHFDGLFGYFGANAVAGEYCDFLFHGS